MRDRARQVLPGSAASDPVHQATARPAAGPAAILALQRRAGNAAVTGMLARRASGAVIRRTPADATRYADHNNADLGDVDEATVRRVLADDTGYYPDWFRQGLLDNWNHGLPPAEQIAAPAAADDERGEAEDDEGSHEFGVDYGDDVAPMDGDAADDDSVVHFRGPGDVEDDEGSHEFGVDYGDDVAPMDGDAADDDSVVHFRGPGDVEDSAEAEYEDDVEAAYGYEDGGYEDGGYDDGGYDDGGYDEYDDDGGYDEYDDDGAAPAAAGAGAGPAAAANPYGHGAWAEYQDWSPATAKHDMTVRGGTVSARHNRGAPYIQSRAEDWPGAATGDTYVSFVRDLRSGVGADGAPPTDAAIAQDLLDGTNVVLTGPSQRRAAAMLTTTVHLAEEWRKQGAVKIYRAYLRQIAAGGRTFDQFLKEFQFIKSAAAGREQVGRFQDARDGAAALAPAEAATAAAMSPPRPDDFSSDDDAPAAGGPSLRKRKELKTTKRLFAKKHDKKGHPKGGGGAGKKGPGGGGAGAGAAAAH